MPEPYWPKHRQKHSYTLGDARNHHTLASIKCSYCKTLRYYRIEELITVFGNIECDDVPLRMRCVKCDGRGNLRLDVENPPAAKLQTLTIRRVERIYHIRRVVWRDEGPR